MTDIADRTLTDRLYYCYHPVISGHLRLKMLGGALLPFPFLSFFLLSPFLLSTRLPLELSPSKQLEVCGLRSTQNAPPVGHGAEPQVEFEFDAFQLLKSDF